MNKKNLLDISKVDVENKCNELKNEIQEKIISISKKKTPIHNQMNLNDYMDVLIDIENNVKNDSDKKKKSTNKKLDLLMELNELNKLKKELFNLRDAIDDLFVDNLIIQKRLHSRLPHLFKPISLEFYENFNNNKNHLNINPDAHYKILSEISYNKKKPKKTIDSSNKIIEDSLLTYPFT